MTADAPLLPLIADPDAPGAMRLDDARFAPALAVIARRHALDLSGAARCRYGSSPVFLTERLAVKLVPPQWAPELERESVALARIEGRLPVETPAVVAVGGLEGWRYLVTRRLGGVSLRDLRDTLSPRERVALAGDVGASLAALHRLPCDDLPTLTVDWPRFAEARVAACMDFQRRHGLGEAAVEAIPAVLAGGAPLVPDARRALLHADLHHEHVMLTQRDGTWTLSGLLDLGDAVVGHPDYELVTPAFFVVDASTGARAAFFDAVGFRCDERASRRLMAWSVLHRFNALSRYLTAPHDAQVFESLRARYWPVLA